jgi:hypothetical protein
MAVAAAVAPVVSLQFVLPTDSPHLAKSAFAMALSPMLWAQHKPDRFDSWSAGIVLLQASQQRTRILLQSLHLQMRHSTGCSVATADSWREQGTCCSSFSLWDPAATRLIAQQPVTHDGSANCWAGMHCHPPHYSCCMCT